MNTAPPASKMGVCLVSPPDIGDLRPGLEMVKTAKDLKQSTLLILGLTDFFSKENLSIIADDPTFLKITQFQGISVCRKLLTQQLPAKAGTFGR